MDPSDPPHGLLGVHGPPGEESMLYRIRVTLCHSVSLFSFLFVAALGDIF